MLAAAIAASSFAEAFGSPAETRGGMPTVPPPYVRFPDGFDRDGCALIPRTGAPPLRVCPARRVSTASAVAGDWARYLGYEGPPAAPSVSPGRVVLLPETLTVAPHGWWRAAGLVRNDTGGIVREVRVTVTLATSGDRPLGSTTVIVPVRDIRPGEPAPFEIRTLIPVQSVHRASWNIGASGVGSTDSASRMAEIEVGRIGLTPSVANAPYRGRLAPEDRAGDVAPTPIGWGILRNWGPLPIAQATIVGMWLDEHGRAVRIVEGRVVPSAAGDLSAHADLLPGGTRTFELFEHGASSSRGAGWRLALWQSTS